MSKTEKSNQTQKTENVDQSVTPAKPDESPQSAKVEQSVATSKPENSAQSEKAKPSIPVEQSMQSTATSKTADVIQSEKAESSSQATTPPQVVTTKNIEKKKPSALVTDDNYFNRDIFRVALEDAGFTVDEAPNGRTCLAKLKEQTYDLLILDLQMPDLTGLDILNQLEAESKAGVKRTMRILVVTANPHMITEDVENLADFTMQKPVNVTDFSIFVKRMMEQTQSQSD